MTAGLLTMSQREFDRAALMRKIQDRELTERTAAGLLGLSVRQVERLYRRYRTGGAEALISRKRGRSSNRRLPEDLRAQAIEIVRSRYADFGPTFAREKLIEVHGLTVSKETLRKWMAAEGLWVPRAKRRDRVQQPRQRRECVGELIQIDGCDHEWFEDRGPRCVLLVYIDDATSRLMQLHFCKAEAMFDYFAATRDYLERFGKPVAFYSDKASVFRVNAADPRGGSGVTQFGRALSDLNIDIICANTPAAKGRVERAHATLQDRLVKELRLRGISSIEAANAFAPEFIADFNARFAKPPKSAFDAHRPLQESEDLADIFCQQNLRTLSKSLTIHYQRRLYILQDTAEARALAGKQVTVFEREDGTVEVRKGSRTFPVKEFAKDEARISQGAIVSSKLLMGALQHIKEQQKRKDAERLAKLRTRRDRELLQKRVAAEG